MDHSKNESAAERYKRAVDRLNEAQRKLGGTPRTDLEARTAATREVEAATVEIREVKEAVKAENTRRNFAGLGNTPLYIACGEQLDPATIATLERRALEIQTERDRAAAERHAAKATKAAAAEQRQVKTKLEVEVIRRPARSPE